MKYILQSVEFWHMYQNVNVNMSSRCPVLFTICSLKCCSIVIHVFWMCHVVCILILPIFVTITLYDHPLWSALFPFTLIPCIHGSTTICMANFRSYGKRNLITVSIFPFKYLSSSQFKSLIVFIICIEFHALLLIWDNRALIGQLKRSVARLGSPAPIVIGLSCKKAKLTSLLL